MLLTRDGHNLSIKDECLVVLLEEDGGYIKSSVQCVYEGCWLKDNRPFIDNLPPSCSGSPIPETQTMHRFGSIHNVKEVFDLLECDVKHSVIKNSLAIEEIVKKKLRD